MKALRDLSKAVAYIRVSTKEQHLGPDAQRKSIEQWAVQHGVQIVAWHTDQGLSGSKAHDKRAGLTEAIRALREHMAGVLVATRRDRFGRDVGVVRDLARVLSAEGSRLVSVAGEGTGLARHLDLDDPDAALSSGINDVLAEHYRLLIKRRTKQALAIKKAKGERIGRIPYGYRLADDGIHLLEDEAEQMIIKAMVAHREAGASLRAVTARLNEGPPPRKSKAWHLTSVVEILERVRGQAA